jgi:hypothetical protein
VSRATEVVTELTASESDPVRTTRVAVVETSTEAFSGLPAAPAEGAEPIALAAPGALALVPPDGPDDCHRHDGSYQAHDLALL